MGKREFAVVLCLYALCFYSIFVLDDLWSASICWMCAAGLSIGEVVRRMK